MMFYNHPAYIGYAHKLDKDDKRIKQYKKEFKLQGFDSTVTWSLDTSIATFIYPRLKVMYEEMDKIVDINAHKGLRTAIEDMLLGFKLLADEDDIEMSKTVAIDLAFTQLGKWHKHLWW